MRIKIHITRGSVAAADDVDAPHANELEIQDTDSVEEIVSAVYKAYPLPKISGGKASWSMVSNLPLAVISQQWDSPKLLHKAPSIDKNSLDIINGVIRIHFNYHAQIEPQILFDILARLRLKGY